jgi:CHAD domain-containing protein
MDQALLARAPEEGARLVALDYLDQAAAAFPRLKDPADTEALHDFRVALRRLRSCLRAYRPQLDESLSKKRRRRLRDLAQATGPGRDTEVQIEWLRPQARHLAASHRAGLAWLLARLDERLREAQSELADRLEDDFPDLEQDLRRRLVVYRTEVHLDAQARRPTFGAATAGILRNQALELETHLSRVGDADDEVEAHEARISAKRLRYLLEPLLDELPSAAPVVKRLKALQEVLGELHDAHFLETELHTGTATASTERAVKLFQLSVDAAPDERVLRAERSRSVESGLIALGRLNRARRDRLFRKVEEEWLEGKAVEFFAELGRVGEGLAGERAGQEDQEERT